MLSEVSRKPNEQAPRIANRRALHEYTITAKIECGMVLVGSEVKSLRNGHAQLADAWAEIADGRLILHGCQIDPYKQASIAFNHEPKRDRVLLVHRRELRKLEQETQVRGVTLVPLSIYFKGGRAKIELGVARGRQQHDKRDAIRQREQKRDLRKLMMHRR